MPERKGLLGGGQEPHTVLMNVWAYFMVCRTPVNRLLGERVIRTVNEPPALLLEMWARLTTPVRG